MERSQFTDGVWMGEAGRVDECTPPPRAQHPTGFCARLNTPTGGLAHLTWFADYTHRATGHR